MQQYETAPGWYTSIFTAAEQMRQKGLVLYGTGRWAEITCRILRLFDVQPMCVCTDETVRPGERWGGAPLYPLEEAAARYPNAVFVAAADDPGVMHKNDRRGRMNQRLRALGVYSAASGFHAMRYTFLLECGLAPFAEAPEAPAPAAFTKERIQNLFLLNHMSFSGSLFLDNLLNGHRQIVGIPFISNCGDLLQVYQNRLRFLGGKDLAAEIACQLNRELTSNLPEEVFPAEYRLGSYWCCNHEGKSEMGVYVDATRFVRALMAECVRIAPGTLTYGDFLKLITAAYSNATGRTWQPERPYYLFYDMHKPNQTMEAMQELGLERDFERVEYFYIIREPVAQTFSWLRYAYRGIAAGKPETQGFVPLEELCNKFAASMGQMLRQKDATLQNVHVLRFEDLKLRHRQTMERLCEYLGIPYEPILEETTVNGCKVYCTSTAVDGSKTYVTGIDPSALQKRDYSTLFSALDEFRLALLYAPLRQAYGYESTMPGPEQFSEQTLRELFAPDFKFYEEIERYDPEKEEKIEKLRAFLESSVLKRETDPFYPLLGKEGLS